VPRPAAAARFARGVAERHDGDAASVGLRPRRDIVGGANARVPACGGADAVVDQQHDGRRTGGGGDRRIPQRAGGGKDHQRREHQPQQRQPPRRSRRRVLLRLDVEQQPRRRKLDPPRPRRDQPQQPPQQRQAEQAEQHQRRRKAERQAHHATALPRLPPCGLRFIATAALPSPMRSCSASSRSFAGRSVRCTVKLQPAGRSRRGFRRGGGRAAPRIRRASSRRGRR
jgi:hypothetical protein